MKSNTVSIPSLPTGSRAWDMLDANASRMDKIAMCREGLTEWLFKFGTRWVAWQEIGDMVGLGFPEREGYVERKTKENFRDTPYLHFRLTQKGLEFINEK